MTSYQKLKAKNKALQEYSNKLLSEPEFLMSEVLANKVRTGIDKALLFGTPFLIHKPTGEVKFNGLFEELMRE